MHTSNKVVVVLGLQKWPPLLKILLLGICGLLLVLPLPKCFWDSLVLHASYWPFPATMTLGSAGLLLFAIGSVRLAKVLTLLEFMLGFSALTLTLNFATLTCGEIPGHCSYPAGLAVGSQHSRKLTSGWFDC